MENRGIVGGLYRLCEFIMRLAYVNLLWILFTLLGLVVLGVFPATAALYAVTRKWELKGTDIPIWKTYWETYKREFIKANVAGYIFLAIGIILFVDLKFFQSRGGSAFVLISYVFLVLFIIYLIMCLFLFPVFAHFDLKSFHYIKQTFLFILSRPLEALIAAAGCLASYFLMMRIPGIILFFSMSLVAYIVTKMAQRGFEKLGVIVESEGDNAENHE